MSTRETNVTGDAYRKLLEYNKELVIFLLPNTAILILYIFIGLTGNAISLFVYGLKIKDVRGKRFFIPYLATVDLLSIAAGAGFYIALNLLPVNFHGDIVCKSMWFLCSWFAIESCLLLLVISVQRYLEVCKPHSNRKLTPFWKRTALLLTVILAFGTSAPNILFHGEITVKNERNLTEHRCGILHETRDSITFFVYNCFLFTLNIAGVIMMTVLYSLIARDIFRLKKRQEKRKNSSTMMARNSVNNPQRHSLGVSLDSLDILGPGSHRTSNISINGGIPRSRSSSTFTEYAIRGSLKVKIHFQRHRHSWMCMIISGLYVIAFTPRITIMFLESLYPELWDNFNSYEIKICLFFYRFYLLNHVINPFIFGLFDKLFREECRKMFRCTDRKVVPTTDL